MIRVGRVPASVPAPAPDPLEAEVLKRQSQIIGGEVHYYDYVADLWFPMDKSIEQLRSRRRAQGILGSQRDADLVTAYERGRGL